MANDYVDEDAASRDPNTREESSKSGQPSPKVVRSSASDREAFTATNRRNCGRRLSVMSQKYVESLQDR